MQYEAALLCLFLQVFKRSKNFTSRRLNTHRNELSITMNYMAWFFPTFLPWYGFSVPVVSYYRIVTAQESCAAPRSLVTTHTPTQVTTVAVNLVF